VRHTFKIYPGYANSVDMTLMDGVTAINHLAITRLALYVGDTLFDSNAAPALFDLTHEDHVKIKLGAASPALAEGRYVCKPIVYAPGELENGWIWPVEFVVDVGALP
jgi:hypothetical protein